MLSLTLCYEKLPSSTHFSGVKCHFKMSDLLVVTSGVFGTLFVFYNNFSKTPQLSLQYLCLISRLYILKTPLGSQKFGKKLERFSIHCLHIPHLWPLPTPLFPDRQHPSPGGTFVTISYPKSTVYIRVTPGMYIPWVWTKVTGPVSYHGGIIQSSFPALKVPCALTIHLSLTEPLATTHLFTRMPFPKCRTDGTHMMKPFQTGFFHLAVYIQVSSICFHGSIAHLFL